MSNSRRTTVRSKWMTVKPGTAERWLRKNSVNRALNEAHARRLTLDMEQGRYLTTHQGVAFDTGGCLLDGQHRLTAIVRSCIPQKMLVTTGLPPESMAAIDVDSKPRSLANVLEIDGGADKYGVSPKLLQTAGRAMYNGPHFRKPLSTSALHEFVTEYVEAIAWAAHQFTKPGRGSGRSSAIAAIARAYQLGRHKGQVGKIARFATVLNTGMTDGTDAERAIIPLRDRLLRMDGRGSGRGNIVDCYKKTASVLDAYMRDKRSGHWDAFKLPCDADAALDDAAPAQATAEAS